MTEPVSRCCIECGRGLDGSAHGPGASLDPDCWYCRQRPHGPVTRKRETA